MGNSDDRKVYLDGHLDVPDDRIEAVERTLTEHISLTRAEAGCLSFQVIPSETIKGRFMVSEVFVDQAAFDAHQTRTKSSDWFEVTEGIPREYAIRVGDEE